MANILIVEDELNMLRLLRDWLEFHNHTVYLATDGQKGLEMLNNHIVTPDVIISDLSMPHMDGLELVTQLKQSEQWKHTHIIIISGSKVDEKNAIGAGANQFLLKPFTLSHLENALSKV
ncbi:MAG: response regulator [bacterium]|nr:response regulator [bacterium]